MAESKLGLEELRRRFDALDQRVRLGIVGAVAVAAAAGTVLWASRGEAADATLFSNLQPDDASRIARRLEDLGVVYALADGGATVRVPEARVHEARLTLASEGLPSGGTVGFELFDEQRFGESDFSEQVKYRRALEGELSRTIGHLAGVERARVHLVLPTRTLFADETAAGRASVVLHLEPGWQMREDQSRGIVNLVASSVQGLSAESVTLVDGEGRRLDGGGGEEELGADALEFRRSLERTKERAAQQLLDAMLGPGESVVRVSADLDFSREERTEETFDPETVATRSVDLLEERDGEPVQNAAGVPGVVSNLPGGEPPTSTLAAEGLSRRRETRNYEVSKVVRRNVEPIGRVRRLQAAVVVDGTWTGEGAERRFTARTAEELAQIEQLVGRALGIEQERGDQVTVASMPFARPEVEPEEALPPGPDELLAPYRPWFPLAQRVALGLLVAVVLLVAWRRAARAAKRRPAAALAPGSQGTTVTVTDLAGDNPVTGQVRNPQLQSPATAEELHRTRELVSELVAREPDTAARVLRTWLTSGGR